LVYLLIAYSVCVQCDEEVKMGKLLGFDYQRSVTSSHFHFSLFTFTSISFDIFCLLLPCRRWFCERNIWMCQVYGQCGGTDTN